MTDKTLAPIAELDDLARRAVLTLQRLVHSETLNCKCSVCVAVGVLYGYHCVGGERPALADSADAPEVEPVCIRCGGETFVVEITRCKGCANEFYTREQSLEASRKYRLDAQQEKQRGEL